MFSPQAHDDGLEADNGMDDGDDRSDAEARAGAGTTADDDVAGAEEARNFIFPIARVKKIMKIDGDVKKMTVDAVRGVAAAVEMFLKQSVEGTAAITVSTGHRQIHDSHFRRFVSNHEEYDFLPNCLPPSSRVPKASSSKARVAPLNAAAATSAAAAAAGSSTASKADARSRGPTEVSPIVGGKQTLLTFGRQQQQQQQQQQQPLHVDNSSGDDFA
jgi:hypothetical protein